MIPLSAISGNGKCTDSDCKLSAANKILNMNTVLINVRVKFLITTPDVKF